MSSHNKCFLGKKEKYQYFWIEKKHFTKSFETSATGCNVDFGIWGKDGQLILILIQVSTNFSNIWKDHFFFSLPVGVGVCGEGRRGSIILKYVL